MSRGCSKDTCRLQYGLVPCPPQASTRQTCFHCEQMSRHQYMHECMVVQEQTALQSLHELTSPRLHRMPTRRQALLFLQLVQLTVPLHHHQVLLRQPKDMQPAAWQSCVALQTMCAPWYSTALQRCKHACKRTLLNNGHQQSPNLCRQDWLTRQAIGALIFTVNRCPACNSTCMTLEQADPYTVLPGPWCNVP